MVSIAIIGLNHESADLSIRERFALTNGQQIDLLKALGEQVEEVVVLCTCNRTEIIYSTSQETGHKAVLERLCEIGGCQRQELMQHLYRYRDEKAVRHLFRVTASLDSLVKGETQITGQVKSAFDLALQQGTVKRAFTRVYQHMLHSAKAVRNQTGLGQGSVSISSVAVQLAQSIFDDLTAKRVLLVGAGEMCSLAAEHFQSAGVSSLTVANRNLEHGRKLARLVDGRAVPLDELPDLLPRHDIVFCSTASEKSLITFTMVERAMQNRQGMPLFLIDISVPRDVEPSVLNLPEVYLYNVDDLKALVDRNLAQRSRDASRAEQIIDQQVREFMVGETESIGPLIKSLHQRVDSIKQEQLDKLFHDNDEWTDEQRQQVDRSIDLIVNKLLHDPLISLRKGMQTEEEPRSRSMASLFRYLFNL